MKIKSKIITGWYKVQINLAKTRYGNRENFVLIQSIDLKASLLGKRASITDLLC